MTPAPITPTGTDTGFFPTSGIPTLLSEAFNGVLKTSNAVIGRVLVENPSSSIAVSNLPANQTVTVSNHPLVQRVALDFPEIQKVDLTFPAVQAVSGNLAITNFPTTQDVRIVATTGLLTALTQGSEHIGRVSIDGPVTGTVTVANPVTSLSISNLPPVQAVTGTVAISNLPSSPTQIKINNDSGSPVPVTIVGGGVGGGTSFDGIIRNTGAQAIPVSIVSGASGAAFDGRLTAGTAHIGQVSLDAPVALANGTTVGVSGSVAVSSIPAITGTVTVANPVTSVAISNLPATQAVSGTVQIGGTPTINVANFPVPPAPVDTQKVSIANTVNVAGTVSINDAAPIRVEVTNAVDTGGSSDVVAGNRLYHDIPYATGTTIWDTGIQVDVPSPWRSIKISFALTGPSVGGGMGTGHGYLKLEGSRNGSDFFLISEYSNIPSGVGGGTIFESDASVYRYFRVVIDESNYTPTRGGAVKFVLDARSVDDLSTNAFVQTQINVDGSPVGVGSVGLPITGLYGEPNIPVAVQGTVPVEVTAPISISGTPTVAVQGTVPVSLASVPTHAVTISGTPTVTSTQSVGVTTTDRSGTIAAGGTAQALSAADGNRRGAWVQNLSSADLYLSDVGVATIGGSSLKIAAGALYEFPHHGIPVSALSIIGSTTGQSFSARVW
ncbi:hypothetical protein ASG59_18755 [Methylobacterium sp. Leaf466]|nr:hypothetical protein ASG59_18755 [Methylobacterium sp. Leaf466]